VEEVQVKLKNIPRKTTAIYPNRIRQSNYPDNSHFLLRVKSTESDKTWAIDITGAQFGLNRGLWPWEEFAQEHIDVLGPVAKLNISLLYVTACSLVEGMPHVDYGISLRAANQVNLAIQAWEKTEMERRIFVLLNDENFGPKQKSLIKVIKDTTRTYVNNSDYSKEVSEAFEYDKQNGSISMERVKAIHWGFINSLHSEPVNKHCSSCSRPATLNCSQCNVHVYCNAICQRAHWPEHKKTCKTKKFDITMRRAGSLLQKLYLMFRAMTFRDEFTKIEDSGRHIKAHAKNAMRRSNKFTVFPDHLFTSKNDRMMILCASRCFNFVGQFTDIIEMMLKGK
jgi:hypothetical protein